MDENMQPPPPTDQPPADPGAPPPRMMDGPPPPDAGAPPQGMPPDQPMPADNEVGEPPDNEGAEGESDPNEEKTIETIVAALREHIFGPAEESIRAKLRESKDVTADVGNMALALIMEAGKQADQSGQHADVDLLMSAGTEIIDDLLDIAEAMGVIKKVTDDDRERSMLAAVRGYLTSADVSPEEQEAARQQLQQMTVDGDTQMAADRIQKLGEKEGVEPFAGAEQAAPQPQQPPRMMGG